MVQLVLGLSTKEESFAQPRVFYEVFSTCTKQENVTKESRKRKRRRKRLLCLVKLPQNTQRQVFFHKTIGPTVLSVWYFCMYGIRRSKIWHAIAKIPQFSKTCQKGRETLLSYRVVFAFPARIALKM